MNKNTNITLIYELPALIVTIYSWHWELKVNHKISWFHGDPFQTWLADWLRAWEGMKLKTQTCGSVFLMLRKMQSLSNYIPSIDER